MKRQICVLLFGAVLGAGGMTLAQHHENGESVRVISAQEIQEKLDGKEAKATIVEVTLQPGKGGLLIGIQARVSSMSWKVNTS